MLLNKTDGVMSPLHQMPFTESFETYGRRSLYLWEINLVVTSCQVPICVGNLLKDFLEKRVISSSLVLLEEIREVKKVSSVFNETIIDKFDVTENTELGSDILDFKILGSIQRF